MDLSSIARRLPDEFLAAPGLAVQRVELLVYRYWPFRSDREQADLAQKLRLVLEPLLRAPRGEVPARTRDECERVVKEWDEGKKAP